MNRQIFRLQGGSLPNLATSPLYSASPYRTSREICLPSILYSVSKEQKASFISLKGILSKIAFPVKHLMHDFLAVPIFQRKFNLLQASSLPRYSSIVATAISVCADYGKQIPLINLLKYAERRSNGISREFMIEIA